MPMRSVTLHPQKVQRHVAGLRRSSKVLRFTGGKGCSKRSTALIVRLFSVFARSEAVYEMQCALVPLPAVFCIRVAGKDIDFVPVSAVFPVLGCTCNTHIFMAWAWMV